MIRALIISFFVFLMSCNGLEEESREKHKLTFEYFVYLDKIESVKMSNNSGRFNLTEKQIDKLKTDLKTMTYSPDYSVKVGAINIELVIDGEAHNLSTSTHGSFVEVHRDIVTKNASEIEKINWIYFKTSGVNFDNYKKEK